MIELNELTHTYTQDGKVIPSVTQILHACKVFDYEYLDPKYAVRGTVVHELTQLYDDKLVEPEDCGEYVGYVNAYKQFLEDNDVKIIDREEIVSYHYKFDKGDITYAGRLDMAATVNGTNYIIDIKTGKTQEWHGYQLAGYGLAYELFYKRAILELRANGSYKFVKSINSRKFSDNYWVIEWKQFLRRYYASNITGS